jgi:hypothetical protein
MRQGCGHQPVMGVLDDTQHQCVGYRKYRIRKMLILRQSESTRHLAT